MRDANESAKFDRANITTVARYAKVSPATVSRTLNGARTVNPKIAKRVWKAVEELRYFRNS
jgi:LacI family transcriptional regulator